MTKPLHIYISIIAAAALIALGIMFAPSLAARAQSGYCEECEEYLLWWQCDNYDAGGNPNCYFYYDNECHCTECNETNSN